MKFYSTRRLSAEVSLKKALFSGLAVDGGLFMPEFFPKFTENEIARMSEMSFQEIAFTVAQKFAEEDLSADVLRQIINEALYFAVPLHELDKNTYVLELWHGPTLAFKDFGARFMAGLISYFAHQDGRKVTILTATSGDTGAAVAGAFHNKENIDVVILFPKNKVSPLQEKQMTTLGANVKVIEIDGTFDDCQKLVKDSFKDKALVARLGLTSANSINIGRLIPQTFYYFYSYSRLKRSDLPLVYAVPSGNFGNLTAGLFAKEMGLKIDRFVAATNLNDVVPEYLQTGKYKPRASVETISNAMDIGSPSNFERIHHMYDKDFAKISRAIWGVKAGEEETKEVLLKYYQAGYPLDPHTAVGLKVLEKYRKAEGDCQAVLLSTAHPAKFKEVLEEIVNERVPLPKELQFAEEAKNHKETMDAGAFQALFQAR